VLGRDHQEAHVTLGRAPADAANRRDQPDVGIAEDHRRLLRREQRALQLVDQRRIRQRPGAQGCDRGEVSGFQRPERLAHGAPTMVGR
jgi:hypothetical protein